MPDMIEYASFGFATLVWWTWPILWAVVVSAVYASYRLSSWRDARYERAHGFDVRPCLVHMGTQPDGIEEWCWQKDGHDGPHVNSWGVPVEAEEAWSKEFPVDEELRLTVDRVKDTHPEVPWNELQGPPEFQ